MTGSGRPDFSGIWELIKRVHDEVEFAAIARNAAKRTLICRPDIATRVRWMVDQGGCADVFEVTESPHVPEGQVYAVDQQSLDVEMNRPPPRPMWW